MEASRAFRTRSRRKRARCTVPPGGLIYLAAGPLCVCVCVYIFFIFFNIFLERNVSRFFTAAVQKKKRRQLSYGGGSRGSGYDEGVLDASGERLKALAMARGGVCLEQSRQADGRKKEFHGAR
jgi:hypothetical protein